MHTQLEDPAQREALAILVEEMGESLQVMGKILRHGPEAVDESVEPNVQYDNLRDLSKEIRDVKVAIRLGELTGLLDVRMTNQQGPKLARLKALLHHIDISPLGY